MHFTPTSEYTPAASDLKGAACAKLPEEEKRLFFSTAGNRYKRAKAICINECPVREQCLELALSYEPPGSKASGHNPLRFGVWGGLTARERERMFGEDDGAEVPDLRSA